MTRSNRITLMQYVILALMTWSFLTTYTALEYQDDIKQLKTDNQKFKSDSKVYHDELLRQHVLYEGERDRREKVEADLADRNERLAAAAAREKAARDRASRSRRAGSAERVRSSVSDQSRASSLFSGSVHDITMYCPTGSRTASGKWPTVGMVATISRSIPFGTRVLIDGLGEFTVEDRIGHGSEFDIFTPSCAEADRFGRQHRRVRILSTN